MSVMSHLVRTLRLGLPGSLGRAVLAVALLQSLAATVTAAASLDDKATPGDSGERRLCSTEKVWMAGRNAISTRRETSRSKLE